MGIRDQIESLFDLNFDKPPYFDKFYERIGWLKPCIIVARVVREKERKWHERECGFFGKNRIQNYLICVMFSCIYNAPCQLEFII